MTPLASVGADEAALLAVDPVVGGGLAVVEDVDVPHVTGRVGDGVHLRHDVLPVGVEVGGAREDTRHPHDGDVVVQIGLSARVSARALVFH
jgi:hypothetical protein